MVCKVGVLVGSIRRDSINLKLAKALVKIAPNELACDFLRIDDLPIFNQDSDQNPPEQVSRAKSQIAASDAFLLVTPEHNRSIPSALKNVLDWASRPDGKSLWPGKPAAIAGASIGKVGTAVAQGHLRSVLAHLDVPTLPQPEIYVHFTQSLIDSDGNIANDGTRRFLQNFMNRYTVWLGKLINPRVFVPPLARSSDFQSA
jgi:chromate reductase, NAD(P)H dehydrogenase (quinone)